MQALVQTFTFVVAFLFKPQIFFQQYCPLAAQRISSWAAAWLFSVTMLVQLFYLRMALLHIMCSTIPLPLSIPVYYALLPVVGLVCHFLFSWLVLNASKQISLASILCILALNLLFWQRDGSIIMVVIVAVLLSGLGLIIGYIIAIHSFISNKPIDIKAAVVRGMYICIAGVGLTWLLLLVVALVQVITLVRPGSHIPDFMEPTTAEASLFGVFMLDVQILIIHGLALWGYIIYLSYMGTESESGKLRIKDFLLLLALAFFSILLLPLLFLIGIASYVFIDLSAAEASSQEGIVVTDGADFSHND